jgi:curved DNA-binding protein
MKDYYKILEIREDASPEVIDKAYKALCAKYHPDKQPLEKRAWAHTKMHELTQAHTILSNPIKRNAYDRAKKARLLRVFLEDGLIGLAKVWLQR